MRGVDVKKTQLICTRRVIGPCAFHWIPRIDQIDEIHALDHAAIGDIKARDDTSFQHGLGYGPEWPAGEGGVAPAAIFDTCSGIRKSTVTLRC